MKRNQQRGVTLTELLTVMVVIGILTAIAVPSYSSYVRKTKRTDAKSALTSVAQQLERCYTRYNAYNDPGCQVTLNYNTPAGDYTIDWETNPPSPSWTSGHGANGFSIKATPIGSQALDTQCGTFQLNQAGIQAATGTTPANCW